MTLTHTFSISSPPAHSQIPVNLRVLLDYSRDKVLDYLGFNKRDDFRVRQEKTNSQLTDAIIDGLANVKDGLSRDCSYKPQQIITSSRAHTPTFAEKAVTLHTTQVKWRSSTLSRVGCKKHKCKPYTLNSSKSLDFVTNTHEAVVPIIS